jgi:hypothetical protein
MKVASTISTINQAEASKPLQQKKMQECNRCKTAGYPNQMIGFEKTGQDTVTGKISWRLVDENGREHKHKFFQDSIQDNPVGIRRVVDITAVTDVVEARNLLASGWEYKTSYPATISNIPHYILAGSK